jgi:PTS system mannose-specific IID component
MVPARASGTTELGRRPGWRLAVALFARSFFLQAAWNTRGMQNVGFCFTMLPVLAVRGGGLAERRAFLTRHLGFFNTNPVLASYAIGAAASAEIAGAPQEAVDVKRGLAGPLGMAGDSLFWGSLRPLATLTGVALVVANRPWAAVVLAAVYNAPHLYFRARGVVAGGSRGAAAASEVVGPGFRRAVALTRAAGAFVAGLVLALATAGGGRIDPARGVIAAALFTLAYVAARLRIPATVVGLAAAAAGVVLVMHGIGGGTS